MNRSRLCRLKEVLLAGQIDLTKGYNNISFTDLLTSEEIEMPNCRILAFYKNDEAWIKVVCFDNAYSAGGGTDNESVRSIKLSDGELVDRVWKYTQEHKKISNQKAYKDILNKKLTAIQGTRIDNLIGDETVISSTDSIRRVK